MAYNDEREDRFPAGRVPVTKEERDLVLAPNEFAQVLDKTKGQVAVIVGPFKHSMSGTDAPVVMDEKTTRFRQVTMEQAIQLFPTADEGSYIVLKNPSAGSPGNEYPGVGNNSSSKLLLGKKVNIKGPVSFALWPGQSAQVIEGHRLRSNQYLLVRVFNAEEAAKNWETATIKGVGGDSKKLAKPENMYIGQLIVVEGKSVSFYIPPTGLEVVPDETGKHVREAVTLERLEYCILLDESGDKRYKSGPDVVFPRPTESFMDWNGTKKFRAVELNENMGLYVKVIQDYTEGEGESKKMVKTGEELFITGKEQRIYMPRQEHAFIRYGDRTIHYATAVPSGEGRYLLNKLTGNVGLETGPRMMLPDPRKEVIVKRVLDPTQVKLWFPGNLIAERVNSERAMAAASGQEGPPAYRKPEADTLKSFTGKNLNRTFTGDEFERKEKYTEPKTITLDTKYEGAVGLQIWTGYAVQVVSRSGKRRVVVGPTPILLEYDETLEVLSLSTGTPKDDKVLFRTVYLLTQGNKVSDSIHAETKDLVPVDIKVSYRVNFEGDPNRWFGVENYIKLLSDHCRSLVRGAIKQRNIEEVTNESIQIVRDQVLGIQDDKGKRTGRKFEENGMRIYDIEVLDVLIGDPTVKSLLSNAQIYAVKSSIEVETAERDAELTARLEKAKRDKADQVAETSKADIARKEELTRRSEEYAREKVSQEKQTAEAILAGELETAKSRKDIEDQILAKEKARADQELASKKDNLDLETKAVVDRMKAIAPEFVTAINNLSDVELTGKIAETMAPLAILGGKSIADVLNNILKGTRFEGIMAKTAELAKPKTQQGK